VLGNQPGVAEAVAVVREDVPGDPRLVAYFVARAPRPTVEELREALRQLLPAPMVPSVFVPLADLPRTPTGKVDRRALPAPEAQPRPPRPESAFAAPESGPEQDLLALWREALRRDGIGVLDNLFDLGAHSLLMVQVYGKLPEEWRQRLSLVDLFHHPTVRSLARHLAGEAAEASASPEEGQERATLRRGLESRHAELRQRRQAGRL
jgi:hypothetical protein